MLSLSEPFPIHEQQGYDAYKQVLSKVIHEPGLLRTVFFPCHVGDKRNGTHPWKKDILFNTILYADVLEKTTRYRARIRVLGRS
jgi:hypothetical protein